MIAAMVNVVGLALWDTVLAVDRWPEAGQEITSGRVIHEGPGGKGANTAAACAMHDVHTVLFTSFGRDEQGTRISDAAAMIPTLWTRAERSGRTPRAFSFLTPDGERTLIGSGPYVPPPITVLHERQLEGVTWIDISDSPLRGEFRDQTTGICGLPAHRLVKENSSGRQWQFSVGSLSDLQLPDERLMRSVGLEFCAMTDGPRGSLLWRAEHPTWERFPAIDVRQIVDSTGAGDAWLGGFLAALEQGRELADAMLQASEAGARACATLGGWPAGT